MRSTTLIFGTTSALLLLLSVPVTTAQRSALPGEVQPTVQDTVHTVWINGPAHSGKNLGKFPTFGTGGSRTGEQCTTKTDRYWNTANFA